MIYSTLTGTFLLDQPKVKFLSQGHNRDDFMIFRVHDWPLIYLNQQTSDVQPRSVTFSIVSKVIIMPLLSKGWHIMDLISSYSTFGQSWANYCTFHVPLEYKKTPFSVFNRDVTVPKASRTVPVKEKFTSLTGEAFVSQEVVIKRSTSETAKR